MKRYRILSFDFDSRAESLKPIQEQWDEKVKEQHIKNQKKTVARLKSQYGELGIDAKIQNFIDLKLKPFSVAAFHNKFLAQIRNAFVIGSYYPALTGACSLGERILNHMMILFRDYHKNAPEYKKVHRKSSFDSWPLAIEALEAWGELLPEAASKFCSLNEERNRAIHFNPETDHNDRELALHAIHLIQEIVSIQFSSFGDQPWYFWVPGETYIKKEWESKPIVKHIFIPNSLLVGPKHQIVSMVPGIVVNDQFEYEEKEITDEEFSQLRQSR